MNQTDQVKRTHAQDKYRGQEKKKTQKQKKNEKKGGCQNIMGHL